MKLLINGVVQAVSSTPFQDFQTKQFQLQESLRHSSKAWDVYFNINDKVASVTGIGHASDLAMQGLDHAYNFIRHIF